MSCRIYFLCNYGPLNFIVIMRSERVVLCVVMLLALVSTTTIDRVVTTAGPRKASVSSPIRLIYINGITDYYGADLVPTALGVPGFTAGNVYNYVAHTFWTYPNTPLSASGIWSDLYTHMKGTIASEVPS